MMTMTRRVAVGRWLAGLLMVAGLAGCASQPTTRVVLLPDADGRVGEVRVANASGEQRIAQAYTEVVVLDAQAGPEVAQAVDRAAFEQAHQTLLAAQPTPPRSFSLQFGFNSRELTPESQALLENVLQVVRERSPTEVMIAGHADAVGQPAHNLALSAERAAVVVEWLHRHEPGLAIEVQYFGDQDPVVAARPGVPEPRNRRVEVVIL